MKLDDVFEFYREHFVPAYSDLVVSLNAKPDQIVTEIENTLSHVAQYFNPDLSEEKKEENVKKAYNHLVRATLDCYKLLCVKLKEQIEKIIIDPRAREFYKDYYDFVKEFKKAREIELENVGIDPLRSLENYKRVAKLGIDLLENLLKHKIIKIIKEKPRVFVTYRFAEEDRKIVESIKKLLELEGFDCVGWKTDNVEIENVYNQVKKEIEDSDCVVVIFTRNWTTSNWLINEMSFAIGKGKPVILFFEDCIDPEERKSIVGIVGDVEYLTFNRYQLDEFILKAIPYIRDFYKKVLERRILFTFF